MIIGRTGSHIELIFRNHINYTEFLKPHTVTADMQLVLQTKGIIQE